jgi:hydroxymethylbilane synthase
MTILRLGTRKSPLALRQTDIVRDLLVRAHPSLIVELVTFTTTGDEILDVPVQQLAADAFTDRVERALLDGTIDVAVHSYKDLPAEPTPGLVIAAVPVRADPREALVATHGRTLRDLPPRSIVGTSSERRAAAVLALRPDLEVRPIRGPVDVRVEKILAGEFDAAVLAVAGLERLGLLQHVTEYFDLETMPPAAGQGALAVQCRSDDSTTRDLLAAIDDVELHAAVLAEVAAELQSR